MTASGPVAARAATPADAPAIARVDARAFRARGLAPAAYPYRRVL